MMALLRVELAIVLPRLIHRAPETKSQGDIRWGGTSASAGYLTTIRLSRSSLHQSFTELFSAKVLSSFSYLDTS